MFDKEGKCIDVWRDADEGVEHVQLLQTPAVISCESRLNVPRFVNIMGLRKAKSKKIEVAKLEALPVKQEAGYQFLGIREHEKKRAAKSVDLDQVVKIIREQSATV